MKIYKLFWLLFVLSLVAIILLLLQKESHAGLFGIDGALFKQETQNIKTELSAVKQESQSLTNELSGLRLQIGRMENNLTLKLNAQADMTAGINSSIKAGRDVNTSSVNDTGLMKAIIGALAGLCSTLIGTLGWCLRALIRRETEKRFYKERALIGIQDTAQLMQLRQAHDNYVKGGKV